LNKHIVISECKQSLNR